MRIVNRLTAGITIGVTTLATNLFTYNKAIENKNKEITVLERNIQFQDEKLSNTEKKLKEFKLEEKLSLTSEKLEFAIRQGKSTLADLFDVRKRLERSQEELTLSRKRNHALGVTVHEL